MDCVTSNLDYILTYISLRQCIRPMWYMANTTFRKMMFVTCIKILLVSFFPPFTKHLPMWHWMILARGSVLCLQATYKPVKSQMYNMTTIILIWTVESLKSHKSQLCENKSSSIREIFHCFLYKFLLISHCKWVEQLKINTNSHSCLRFTEKSITDSSLQVI